MEGSSSNVSSAISASVRSIDSSGLAIPSSSSCSTVSCNAFSILSLKLSELQVIYDDIGEYPILLLDDFMSELDEKRISNFLQSINQIQVIITCTKEINIPNSRLYYVEKGNIINK